MGDIRYLTVAELLGLHEALLEDAGTSADLLDEGKLESASLRPLNLAHYEGAELLSQAAGLIVGIALAHAFSDGNKRLALVAGELFLLRNGVALRAEPLAFAEQILAVINRDDALSAATERLVNWLRAHAVSI